jgi:adenylate cyclase
VAEGYAALVEALARGVSPTASHVINDALATAFRLDPDCYEAHVIAGAISIAQHEYHKAITYFERAIELDPDAYWPAGMVVQAYQALGETAATAAAARRALASCERILADEPDHSGALGFLVTSLAELGEAERARAWATRALLFDPDNARLHYNVACGMARLLDADMAVDLIEPWFDRVSPGWVRWIQNDNSLDPIRAHPRFVALMERGARRIEQDSLNH